MATETTRQIIQEAPEIEAKRLELLNAVRNFVDQNLFAVGQEAPPPVLPPAFQVAGLTPLQQQASARAAQGVGAIQPFVDNTLDALRRSEDYAETYGFGGLTEALGATREGNRPYHRPHSLRRHKGHSHLRTSGRYGLWLERTRPLTHAALGVHEPV